MSDSSHWVLKGRKSLSICFLPRSCSIGMWVFSSCWGEESLSSAGIQAWQGCKAAGKNLPAFSSWKTSLDLIPDASLLPYDLRAPQQKKKKKKTQGLLLSILKLMSNCCCWPKAGLSICVWEVPFILVSFILFKVTFKLCMQHLSARGWTQLFVKQVHEPVLFWLSLIPFSFQIPTTFTAPGSINSKSQEHKLFTQKQ